MNIYTDDEQTDLIIMTSQLEQINNLQFLETYQFIYNNNIHYMYNRNTQLSN